MEHQSMLRDPNENKQQTSVFRFDAYPGPSNVYSWNSAIPEYGNTTSQLHQTSFSNLIGQQITPPIVPEVPSSFSFGNSTNINLSGHFPFHITNYGPADGTDRRVRLVLGKRKTDSPPPQPCKQHITEEKMAEHMSKLHISSETVTSPLEPEAVKTKRLYMCEEMRKLQTEPLLPTSLVSQMQRPCTALVVWQPPTKVLPALGTESSSNGNEEKSVKNSDDSAIDTPIEFVDMDSVFGGDMDLDS